MELAHFSIPMGSPKIHRVDLLCRPCRMAPPAFAKAAAFGAYQGHLRSLIHLLKYDGMHPVANGLSRLLARCLDGFPATAPRRMLVVPVPMHREKQRRRGFNHAALLAQAVVSKSRRGGSGWDLHFAQDVLERSKATVSQAGLTTAQRRQNLRGAFTVSRSGKLRGKDVLLVDDVLYNGRHRPCMRPGSHCRRRRIGLGNHRGPRSTGGRCSLGRSFYAPHRCGPFARE